MDGPFSLPSHHCLHRRRRPFCVASPSSPSPSFSLLCDRPRAWRTCCSNNWCCPWRIGHQKSGQDVLTVTVTVFLFSCRRTDPSSQSISSAWKNKQTTLFKRLVITKLCGILPYEGTILIFGKETGKLLLKAYFKKLEDT